MLLDVFLFYVLPYFPNFKEFIIKKIHAQVYKPKWLTENRHLRGDNFDSAYMKEFGYDIRTMMQTPATTFVEIQAEMGKDYNKQKAEQEASRRKTLG